MWAKDEDSEQTAAASALIPHRTAVSTCRLYTRGGDAVQALNQRDHKGGEWMTESGSSARERGGAGDRRAGIRVQHTQAQMQRHQLLLRLRLWFALQYNTAGTSSVPIYTVVIPMPDAHGSHHAPPVLRPQCDETCTVRGGPQ